MSSKGETVPQCGPGSRLSRAGIANRTATIAIDPSANYQCKIMLYNTA